MKGFSLLVSWPVLPAASQTIQMVTLFLLFLLLSSPPHAMLLGLSALPVLSPSCSTAEFSCISLCLGVCDQSPV